MTTRRPTLHSNKSRPLSAIFLGSISTPSHLPALPEPPPSPGADSDGSESGLPSPPATNSTGSGSNGDDTTNFGSVRQRPASYSHPHPDTSESTPSMPSAIYNPEIRSRSTTNINEEQHMSDDDEHDNDFDDGEDNTAKMDKRRSLKGSNENTMALQRVKSLAQRNRMVSETEYVPAVCTHLCPQSSSILHLLLESSLTRIHNCDPSLRLRRSDQINKSM